MTTQPTPLPTVDHHASDHHPSDAAPSTSGGDRLTTAAGWSLIAIAALHTLFFAANPHWGTWMAGPLRDGSIDPEAITIFWALPGGLAVPVALLGVLVLRDGRRRVGTPLSVPLGLLGWAVLCTWIVGPSGFMTALVPVTLLLLARRRPR